MWIHRGTKGVNCEVECIIGWADVLSSSNQRFWTFQTQSPGAPRSFGAASGATDMEPEEKHVKVELGIRWCDRPVPPKQNRW